VAMIPVLGVFSDLPLVTCSELIRSLRSLG
jgi:hypothetical protein